jgi:hypothetical protein
VPNFVTRPLSHLPMSSYFGPTFKAELDAVVPAVVTTFVSDPGAEPPEFTITFDADIAGHEATIDAVIGMHQNLPIDDEVPLRFRRVGDLYTATPQGGTGAPVMSIFDFPVVNELEIEAGAFSIVGTGHVIGDNVTLQVIDKDGVLESIHGQPAGVVVPLHTMVDHEYINPAATNDVVIRTPGRTPIMAGLYLRTKYESHNTDPSASPKLSVKFQVYEA